jgi:hypothetical protein
MKNRNNAKPRCYRRVLGILGDCKRFLRYFKYSSKFFWGGDVGGGDWRHCRWDTRGFFRIQFFIGGDSK